MNPIKPHSVSKMLRAMIATGRGDLVIGKTEVLEVPVSDPHEHAYGLIELKTDKSNFRRAQNFLELTALSQVSRIGRKVALLASDCGKKWELYYFKSYNTFVRGGCSQLQIRFQQNEFCSQLQIRFQQNK